MDLTSTRPTQRSRTAATIAGWPRARTTPQDSSGSRPASRPWRDLPAQDPRGASERTRRDARGQARGAARACCRGRKHQVRARDATTRSARGTCTRDPLALSPGRRQPGRAGQRNRVRAHQPDAAGERSRRCCCCGRRPCLDRRFRLTASPPLWAARSHRPLHPMWIPPWCDFHLRTGRRLPATPCPAGAIAQVALVASLCSPLATRRRAEVLRVRSRPAGHGRVVGSLQTAAVDASPRSTAAQPRATRGRTHE